MIADFLATKGVKKAQAQRSMDNLVISEKLRAKVSYTTSTDRKPNSLLPSTVCSSSKILLSPLVQGCPRKVACRNMESQRCTFLCMIQQSWVKRCATELVLNPENALVETRWGSYCGPAASIKGSALPRDTTAE